MSSGAKWYNCMRKLLIFDAYFAKGKCKETDLSETFKHGKTLKTSEEDHLLLLHTKTLIIKFSDICMYTTHLFLYNENFFNMLISRSTLWTHLICEQIVDTWARRWVEHTHHRSLRTSVAPHTPAHQTSPTEPPESAHPDPFPGKIKRTK